MNGPAQIDLVFSAWEILHLLWLKVTGRKPVVRLQIWPDHFEAQILP